MNIEYVQDIVDHFVLADMVVWNPIIKQSFIRKYKNITSVANGIELLNTFDRVWEVWLFDILKNNWIVSSDLERKIVHSISKKVIDENNAIKFWYLDDKSIVKITKWVNNFRT